MRHFQTTIPKCAMQASRSGHNLRVARWRTAGYIAASAPFLLMITLAWFHADWTRPKIPDWRPVLALADASWKKGDLHNARYLYLQVDQIASWQQDWEGLVAAACGIRSLDGTVGPYSKTFAILVRAMMAAESKRSRTGISAVARAFSMIGEHKAATMVASRIRTDWPQETRDSGNFVAANCWSP
jgi:hypothetical protein